MAIAYLKLSIASIPPPPMISRMAIYYLNLSIIQYRRRVNTTASSAISASLPSETHGLDTGATYSSTSSSSAPPAPPLAPPSPPPPPSPLAIAAALASNLAMTSSLSASCTGGGGVGRVTPQQTTCSGRGARSSRPPVAAPYGRDKSSGRSPPPHPTR